MRKVKLYGLNRYSLSADELCEKSARSIGNKFPNGCVNRLWAILTQCSNGDIEDALGDTVADKKVWVLTFLKPSFLL
jgi:hypothetical protein